MKSLFCIAVSATLALLFAPLANAAPAQNLFAYLIANNDYSLGNSATFWIMTEASLRQKAVVQTGGNGNDGIGAVATKRITVARSAQPCVFVADANTSDIAGIDISTLTATGIFKGSSTDMGQAYGLGVVNNGKYLYANFTGSKTIAAFQIEPGCTLTFLQDVSGAGLGGAPAIDMQVSKRLLVVSFQDGSIESFDVSAGVPVANGDLQMSTAATQGFFPSGVDLSADGHYALFGDGGATPTAEVSDISSGKLTPTVVYKNLGQGQTANAIWLSPDQKFLYMNAFSGGRVNAVAFDSTTGVLTPGCTSAVLNGTPDLAGLTTATATGSGRAIYVAEPDADLGIVKITETSAGCTLVESPGSPVLEKNTITIESLAAYPPRRF